MDSEEIMEIPVIQPSDAAAAPADPVALQKIFHALANVHRLRIYQLLTTGQLGSCCGRIEWFEKGCCVTDLVNLIGLSQPTISHHLSILQDAGLIRSEKRGLWTCFFPDPDAVGVLQQFVDQLRTCCATPADVPAKQE